MDSVAAIRKVIHSFCATVASSLPKTPVEPVVIKLSNSLASSSNSVACKLVAPTSIRACKDIDMSEVPLCACFGRNVQFDLRLNEAYASRDPEELEIAAASLQEHADAIISLKKARETEYCPLSFSSSPCISFDRSWNDGRRVVVTVSIPVVDVDAKTEVCMVIHSVTFAGKSVLCAGVSFPIRIRLGVRLCAPMSLGSAFCQDGTTPSIASDGTLYAPIARNSVRIFAADGTPQPTLHFPQLDKYSILRDVAFASNDLLLLASTRHLVAVDILRKSARWWTLFDDGCNGIAVLPNCGVAFVSKEKGLVAYRIEDGAFLNKFHCPKDPTYIAADTCSSAVFVSTFDQVSAYLWNGSALIFDGNFNETFETTGYSFPLAVMSTRTNKQTKSYLIVGKFDCATLRVFSLPDRRLIHIHNLEGIKVTGLAADPSGFALAVCDTVSSDIVIFSWPLEGMNTAE